MEKERTLVLIKPDAMMKGLAGTIISEINLLGLKMIGLKLVNVKRELAEKHYEEHKQKPFFEDLIKHITGELHNNENVIAIVYEGKNCVKKLRELAGATNPDDALPNSLRGKYGKIHTKTRCHETVIHTSDSSESANREIHLWFKKEELIN
jgi:nucleoside-diphosphate kinase